MSEWKWIDFDRDLEDLDLDLNCKSLVYNLEADLGRMTNLSLCLV